MSPQTLTRPPQSRADTRRLVAGGLAVVAVVIVVLAGSWALRGPDFVDRVTIENPTAFDVNVDVAGSDGRVLGLTQVTAGRTKDVRGVLDQGDTWTMMFSYAQTRAGSIELDRSALEAEDWRIVIPPEVERRLEAAGYAPSER